MEGHLVALQSFTMHFLAPIRPIPWKVKLHPPARHWRRHVEASGSSSKKTGKENLKATGLLPSITSLAHEASVKDHIPAVAPNYRRPTRQE